MISLYLSVYYYCYFYREYAGSNKVEAVCVVGIGILALMSLLWIGSRVLLDNGVSGRAISFTNGMVAIAVLFFSILGVLLKR